MSSRLNESFNSPITTIGAGAYGVIAQSVAGGGGLVMSGNSMMMKSGGGSGTSGKVTVNVNASIVTSGDGSNATYLVSPQDPILNIASGVALVGGRGGSAVVE